MRLPAALTLMAFASCAIPAPRLPAPSQAPQRCEPDELLQFEIREGATHNSFYRKGHVAVHLVARSGTSPRLLAAFPAGNSAAALWFEPSGTHVAVEGPLTGVSRSDGMNGATVRIRIDRDRVRIGKAALGSARSLRQEPVEGDARSPAARYEVVAGPPVVLQRTLLDGKHHVSLSLQPLGRSSVRVGSDGGIELAAPESEPVRMQLEALTDETPLTPIPSCALLQGPASDPALLRALAFLSYREKLLAGSWRFLTYFGRDTLLSIRLLRPVLAPDVIESGLGAVIERMSPRGDVAHEEELGDFVYQRNLESGVQPVDLAHHAYTMIDDEYLLAPVLEDYFATPAGGARAAAFLARTTSRGVGYRQAILRNLAFVLDKASAFAATGRPESLVALDPDSPVGNWRDSPQGLGGGRYPYDVNAALVPAALQASARLYRTAMFDDPASAVRAEAAARAWQDTQRFFRVEIAAEEARRRVATHALEIGLPQPVPHPSAIVLQAISLDRDLHPVPIMNSDDGFLLLFGHPPASFLEEAVTRLTLPFPAGLDTPVGIVVANPAYAPEASVRAMFGRDQYHGAVVWSWQQAMLAAGIRRQLDRGDLPASTRRALELASQHLDKRIAATASLRTSELWSWQVRKGAIELVPFGQRQAHADESNAVQLWSTVYLGVGTQRAP